MAQPAPDFSGRRIHAGQRHEGEPHEPYGQMPGPKGRRPHSDQPLRPIKGKAPDDEHETSNGHNRIKALKWARAKPFNQAHPRLAKGCETMHAQKNDDPYEKNKHVSLPPLTCKDSIAPENRPKYQIFARSYSPKAGKRKAARLVSCSKSIQARDDDEGNRKRAYGHRGRARPKMRSGRWRAAR